MGIQITAHKQQLYSNSDSADVSINFLPSELIMKILSFFDELELNKLQTVNRQFRDCVQHIKLDRYVKNFHDVHLNFTDFIATSFPQEQELDKQELDDLFRNLSICSEEITQVYKKPMPITNAIECAKQVNDKLRRTCLVSLSKFNSIGHGFVLYKGNELYSQLPYIRFLVDLLKQNSSQVSPADQALFIRQFIDSYLLLAVTTPFFSDVLALVNPEVSERIRPYIFFQQMLNFVQKGQTELIIDKFNTIKDQGFRSNILKELCSVENEHYLELVIEIFKKIDFPDANMRDKILIHIGKYAALDKLAVHMGYFNIKDAIFICQGALKERRLSDNDKIGLADCFLKASKLELAIFMTLDETINSESKKDLLVNSVFDEYIKKLPRDLEEKQVAVEKFLIKHPYLDAIQFRLFLIRCMLQTGLNTEAWDQLKAFNQPQLVFKDQHIQSALRDYFGCNIEAEKNINLINFLEPSIRFEVVLSMAQNLKADSFLENWNRTIALFSSALSLESQEDLNKRLKEFLRTHLLYEELFTLPVKDTLYDRDQHYLDFSMSQIIPLHLRTKTMKALLENLNDLKQITMPATIEKDYRDVVNQLIRFKEEYQKFRSVVFNIYIQTDESDKSRIFVNRLIDIFFSSGLGGAQVFFDAESSLSREGHKFGETLLECFRKLNAVKALGIWV